MVKILIVVNDDEYVDVAGMPAGYTINKIYKCRMCPNCRYNLLNGHSTCVEKYYNLGERTNDR